VSEYLLAQGASLDIFSAIALQKVDEVRSIVKANPNLLSQRLGFAHNEWQPLHFAVLENLLDMVQLLLDCGADIHARTAWGMTPLCLAIHAKNEKVAKLLTERGAKVDLSAAIVSHNGSKPESFLMPTPRKCSQEGKISCCYITQFNKVLSKVQKCF
jgi:ankyrin repeat protein